MEDGDPSRIGEMKKSTSELNNKLCLCVIVLCQKNIGYSFSYCNVMKTSEVDSILYCFEVANAESIYTTKNTHNSRKKSHRKRL
jgi:hypothetical protein